MNRGNMLALNVFKLNTFVNIQKDSVILNDYLDRILNKKFKNVEHTKDYNYVTLDLLFLSMSMLSIDSMISKNYFNKIDKKELSAFLNDLNDLNYYMKQLSNIKTEKLFVEYIKESMINGSYVLMSDGKVKFDNSLIVDAEWLIEFCLFLINSIINNKYISSDNKKYSFKVADINIESFDLKNVLNETKLYEYCVFRKDGRKLTYQNVLYIKDVLKNVNGYNFDELKKVNGFLASSGLILSVSKLNVNLSKKEKSVMEMLFNEDKDIKIIKEYVKQILNCRNSSNNINKEKELEVYELLRIFAHGYNYNLSLEEARGMLDNNDKFMELYNMFALFYLNYVYDFKSVDADFDYTLYNLDDLKPEKIDYETDDYKEIIEKMSDLNKKIISQNRRINKYLDERRKVSDNKELVKEKNLNIAICSAQLEDYVFNLKVYQNKLSLEKAHNLDEGNINKMKIKYIKEAIASSMYRFNKDSNLIIFDLYDFKNFHHTFHLEITMDDFKSILLSDKNVKERLKFYQL